MGWKPQCHCRNPYCHGSREGRPNRCQRKAEKKQGFCERCELAQLETEERSQRIRKRLKDSGLY